MIPHEYRPRIDCEWDGIHIYLQGNVDESTLTSLLEAWVKAIIQERAA